MNKIFSVLLLVTFNFGIISCSSEDPSGATPQLGQVLDQPNSTDPRKSIDLPNILGSCYLIENSTIDNSTVDESSISDNSSIKDSTVTNCSTITRSIVDNSSTVCNSTIDNSTINNSTVCDSSVRGGSTLYSSTVNGGSTVQGGSTVRNSSTICNNSTIDNSTIDNSTICNSTISNRTIQNLTMSDSDAPYVVYVSSDNDSLSYSVGSKISIKVGFNEDVFVDNSTGNPLIELETGSTDDNATYISGNSTSILRFIYTVVSGDNATDLDYKSTSALSANSGTIRDNSSNDATLTLPSPGSSGSLGANKAIVIDTTGPTPLLISCYIVTACVDVPPSRKVLVKSSEVGTAYLVKNTVSVSNLASITSADGTLWNSVSISSTSSSYYILLTGLAEGTYRVYAADSLGNLSGYSVGTGGRSGALGTMTIKND